jgi:hypothetical protein
LALIPSLFLSYLSYSWEGSYNFKRNFALVIPRRGPAQIRPLGKQCPRPTSFEGASTLESKTGRHRIAQLRLQYEANHEKRAAMICLLTAALAEKVRRQSSAKLKAVGSACHRGHCGSLGRKRVLKTASKKMASKVTVPVVYNRRTLISIRLYPAKWTGSFFS